MIFDYKKYKNSFNLYKKFNCLILIFNFKDMDQSNTNKKPPTQASNSFDI